MTTKTHTAQAETGKHGTLSTGQQHERKDRVLTKGTPSIVRSIADAVIIKDDDLFCVTEPDGNMPADRGHGCGLYYHDCRYLNGYQIKLAGVSPDSLVASAEQGHTAIYELTNPDIKSQDGKLIKKEQIGIKWVRLVDGEKLVLHDLISIQNYGLEPCAFPLTLQFRAEFEDVFAVRGLLRKKLGEVEKPEWHDGTLRLGYQGADNRYRSLTVAFSDEAHIVDDTTVSFDISLEPREQKELSISVRLAETAGRAKAKPGHNHHSLRAIHAAHQESVARWLGRHSGIATDNLLLNNIIEQSLRDLRALRSTLHDRHYHAAGLPWFGTLFGRDSAITCLQTLAYRPGIAADTLRLLALLQGDKKDDYKDEQPGKIIHSVRLGEMARTGAIPHSPYYGSIDATPLFLILIGEYSAWTGDISLFHDLGDNVERALLWIDEFGDTDGDGFIDYESTSGSGLINQGWKDSGDAIVNADGSLAEPPIALAEVQGYVYMAKQHMARLFRRAGDNGRARSLEAGAAELKSRFNKHFWLEKEGHYAMALQKGGKPCAVLSSNPGQAMWSGIVDREKAAHTVQMLMSDRMFSGWGIRTLSNQATRYNPVGYHLGTVWPHDNALIAAGLRRYGFDKQARRVCEGIIDAAMYFQHYRLPELFAGFGRQEYGVPVSYPVACHPQAWAASSVPYMMANMLGLTPEAFDNRLRIINPILPDLTHVVEVTDLRVGSATTDLRFERKSDGEVQVTVLKATKDLEVQVE